MCNEVSEAYVCLLHLVMMNCSSLVCNLYAHMHCYGNSRV